jgi:hypothetical protein
VARIRFGGWGSKALTERQSCQHGRSVALEDVPTSTLCSGSAAIEVVRGGPEVQRSRKVSQLYHSRHGTRNRKCNHTTLQGFRENHHVIPAVAATVANQRPNARNHGIELPQEKMAMKVSSPTEVLSVAMVFCACSRVAYSTMSHSHRGNLPNRIS